MLLVIHPLPPPQQQSRMLTWRILWMILPHFLLLVGIPVYTLGNCYSIYITCDWSSHCSGQETTAMLLTFTVILLHQNPEALQRWDSSFSCGVVVLYHDKQITCEGCGSNIWFSVLCAQVEELFTVCKTTPSLILLQSFGGSLRGVRWEAVSDFWGPREDGVPGTGSVGVCVPSPSAALILNDHTYKDGKRKWVEKLGSCWTPSNT